MYTERNKFFEVHSKYEAIIKKKGLYNFRDNEFMEFKRLFDIYSGYIDKNIEQRSFV